MIFSFLRNNCKSILNSLSICYHCNHFFLKAVTLGIICSTPLSFCNSLPQKHSYDLGLCDLTLPTVYYKSPFRAQARCVWFFQVKQNLEHLTTQCHCILIGIFQPFTINLGFVMATHLQEHTSAKFSLSFMISSSDKRQKKLPKFTSRQFWQLPASHATMKKQRYFLESKLKVIFIIRWKIENFSTAR